MVECKSSFPAPYSHALSISSILISSDDTTAPRLHNLIFEVCVFDGQHCHVKTVPNDIQKNPNGSSITLSVDFSVFLQYDALESCRSQRITPIWVKIHDTITSSSYYATFPTEQILPLFPLVSSVNSTDTIHKHAYANKIMELSMNLMGVTGEMQVTVHEGTGLMAADLNGLSDPYFVIFLIDHGGQCLSEPRGSSSPEKSKSLFSRVMKGSKKKTNGGI